MAGVDYKISKFLIMRGFLISSVVIFIVLPSLFRAVNCLCLNKIDVDHLSVGY